VVGEFTSSTGEHAFAYSGNGAFTDLGAAAGPGTYSNAQAINNSGQIAGVFGGGSVTQHAFLYSAGTFNDLGAPPNMEIATAYGINNSGQVVGWAEPSNSPDSDQAFLYSGGAFHTLGTLGGANSWAYAINDSGQVVGWADSSAGNSRAFLYTNGGITDLGTLGGASSTAHAINDAGEVVGASDPANAVNGNTHAFLYGNGSMTDLGLLPGKPSSLAAGINDNGQIVGESFGGPGLDSRAFLYENATMYDLNSLLVNQPGYIVADALGINDSGQIVGIADMPGGNLNAVLLTPTVVSSPPANGEPSAIPLPPAAWAALTAAPLLLLGRRMRRVVGRH
jgi:probable HAF family extracellular repeat protein